MKLNCLARHSQQQEIQNAFVAVISQSLELLKLQVQDLKRFVSKPHIIYKPGYTGGLHKPLQLFKEH